MGRSRRHARSSRVLGSARVTVSLVLGALLLAGGGAYAAYRYDAANTDRLLPGVTIGGVEVGEMSRAEAIELLDEESEERLNRDIQIAARDQTWSVSARTLGTTSLVEPVVDRAVAAGEGYSWPERVFRRVFNSRVEYSSDLRFKTSRQRIRTYLEGVATEIATEPTNAQVDYENGEVVLRRPEAGWQLPVDDAVRAVRQALAGGSETVQLPLQKLSPDVTRDNLGNTIVVDLSDLELTLYDGLRVNRTYPVAAGSPSYPTPQGEWEIIDKAENPTWNNPAPDGWGKDMPLSIGPGPGNPLGTRALYLNAPGIRIHGTPASYSIGSYASHGCIRMLMSDVEELYDIVPIGTMVHVVP
ncbi:MAG: L,D-transpeptidase family protein [Actinomycetota bacterium]